ncbi:MAG: EamA family transporter RarD [bacterium]
MNKSGALFALGAYGLWGIFPIYFKWLIPIPADVIVAHRVLWSLVLTLIFLLLSRQLSSTLKVVKENWPGLILSGLLIAANWLIFVWAVNDGRILETSLGYFLNPLVSIILGVLFLSERMTKLQWFAAAFAAMAIIVQVVLLGYLPWVSLVLAVSFALYGFVRKKMHIKSLDGLFAEVLLMLPFALLYLLLTDESGYSGTQWGLLVGLGAVTSIPLLFFAAALRRLPLYVSGFFQYLAPTLTLLIAVFIYHEPLPLVKLSSFILVWIGLFVFTLDAILRHKKSRKLQKEGTSYV